MYKTVLFVLIRAVNNDLEERIMNLLEHYIVEIHSEKDITNEFTQHCGYVPKEPFYK